MHLSNTATAFAATVIGFLTTSGLASAQRFDPGFPQRSQTRFNLGGLHMAARAIEKNAHDLHEEVDRHFRRSPAYDHLHRHTREIERLAKAIHHITDNRDGYRQLRQAVNRLDDQVHHFVEVVQDSRRFRGMSEHAYAHLWQEVQQLHRAVIAMKRQLD
jgi:hypothetical protein